MNAHGRLPGTTALTITTLILSFGIVSCSAVEPIYVYETKTLIQDRYVPIPEGLTKPVEVVELPENFDVYTLGAAYKAQKVRAMQCNGQLAEIANIHQE